ncbi:glycosyltransferase family 4 protein [Candidatus Peregrinibacteria bacterium]|jgi:glycosyltransferase involved in cell wall biosynthesis|nr:glycosyltransferase family 4 protein [Candidatus Peregrinibacteria bacterium]MBT4147851.1 glycosyltransferase family 4 protein [Candidatus Peregrinibacteria bacterium]MBT4366192.1 glycosyltransferase family 4 protein [Candidatus Peregrinibacteria bacterium]MBT4456321.1 glycosyltransferase family 4 protein [Candidatus Peregrinibacteria bacterium]
MKIGIDCRMFSSNFTGIGRYTAELVKNLEKDPKSKTHEFVLFFNEPEFSSYKPTKPNFKPILVDAPHYSLKEQTKFLGQLNEQNLDLMHFTHFNAPIRYKKPFIVTIHDLTHTLFPGRKMRALPYRMAYKKVIKNAVKKATHIIAVSENTKKDLIRIHKTNPEKIHTIYEGANKEFHQLKPAELKTLKTPNIKEPFLLYTGVHRYHKNLPRLIKAFSLIAHKNRNLDLVITGKPDPLYPEAEEATKQFHLENRIHFTGLVPEDELIALYNLAEAYVFPSLYEGFGLPVLEAFACGTPVVASNVSSIPEIAGKAALLFDPENPKDIAEKIQKLLKSHSLQNDLRQKGLARVKAFSWQKMAKEILSLYNRTA